MIGYAQVSTETLRTKVIIILIILIAEVKLSFIYLHRRLPSFPTNYLLEIVFSMTRSRSIVLLFFVT